VSTPIFVPARYSLFCAKCRDENEQVVRMVRQAGHGEAVRPWGKVWKP
jgi:hypothetical protein